MITLILRPYIEIHDVRRDFNWSNKFAYDAAKAITDL